MSDNRRWRPSTPDVAPVDRDAVVPANQHTSESDANSPAALVCLDVPPLCSCSEPQRLRTNSPRHIGNIYRCAIGGVTGSLFWMMLTGFRQALGLFKTPLCNSRLAVLPDGVAALMSAFEGEIIS